MKKEKRYIIRFVSLVTIAVFLMALPLTVWANDLRGYSTDVETGWTFRDQAVHLGSKTTRYTYFSPSVKSEYSSYVVNGIAMWGSAISCTEGTTSNSIGTISVCNDSFAYYTAVAEGSYNSSTTHVLTWSITINSYYFDENATAGKNRTIAHEIGHVYGLGHVDNTEQIMYHTYSETISVTADDLKGMNVMTHTHVHDGTESYALQRSQYTHKKRCTTCEMYTKVTCTYTSTHLKKTHTLQFSCVCGNNSTVSYPCSGNPCTLPF